MVHGIYNVKLFRLNYATEKELLSEQIVIYRCHSFIHLVVCLTTGPKPLPNRTLHIVLSRAFSFNCEYPLLPLRSSSSFLGVILSNNMVTKGGELGR